MDTNLEIDNTPTFNLTIITNHTIYLIWLPLLLTNKNLAPHFHQFTNITQNQLNKMKTTTNSLLINKKHPKIHHLLYLLSIGLGTT